jgi:hypothetical protein
VNLPGYEGRVQGYEGRVPPVGGPPTVSRTRHDDQKGAATSAHPLGPAVSHPQDCSQGPSDPAYPCSQLPDFAQKARATATARTSHQLSRQRPTLPGSCPPSTIGAGGLNFRVRDGNGCGPTAMVTGNLALFCGSHCGLLLLERSIASTSRVLLSKPSAD